MGVLAPPPHFESIHALDHCAWPLHFACTTRRPAQRPAIPTSDTCAIVHPTMGVWPCKIRTARTPQALHLRRQRTVLEHELGKYRQVAGSKFPRRPGARAEPLNSRVHSATPLGGRANLRNLVSRGWILGWPGMADLAGDWCMSTALGGLWLWGCVLLMAAARSSTRISSYQ